MTTRDRLRRTVLTGIGAGLLLTTAAGPASAERLGLDDPADASASLSDILAVSAVHGTQRVTVRVDFAELEPTSDFGPSSLSVFIDTDTSKKGPEFRIGTGLQQGTDYQLVRMKNWKPVGEALSCEHDVKLNFKANRVRTRVDRSCLGDPAEGADRGQDDRSLGRVAPGGGLAGQASLPEHRHRQRLIPASRGRRAPPRRRTGPGPPPARGARARAAPAPPAAP